MPAKAKQRPRAASRTAARPARAGRRDTSVPHIFEALRGRIAQQEIPPGAKLRETDLALEFGVARTRIRDALAALEQRGLVERIPNRGAVVMRLDMSQAFHIYDLREVLEGLAARLATENGPAEVWRAELERFSGPMAELVAKGELDEYIGHYERLRIAIIEAADNPVLTDMLDIVFEKIQVLIRRIIILPGRAEAGRRQHVAMLQAMGRGDAAEAERQRRAGLHSARLALEKYQRYIL